MKKLNLSQLVILCLVGVLIFQQFFMADGYRKEYEQMLREKEESYKVEIDRLNKINDSIFAVNKQLIDDIGTIDDKIAEKNAQLSNLRRKYAEQVDKLDDMSDDELSTTFANTFK
jgi:chromosome segregation ATPase